MEEENLGDSIERIDLGTIAIANAASFFQGCMDTGSGGGVGVQTH